MCIYLEIKTRNSMKTQLKFQDYTSVICCERNCCLYLARMTAVNCLYDPLLAFTATKVVKCAGSWAGSESIPAMENFTNFTFSSQAEGPAKGPRVCRVSEVIIASY